MYDVLLVINTNLLPILYRFRYIAKNYKLCATYTSMSQKIWNIFNHALLRSAPRMLQISLK